MTRTARNRGMTLTEVMVTVSVIGILGLYTSPHLMGFLPGNRASQAAKLLAGEMNLVRMRSIARNVVHHVTFDPSTDTVTVYEDDDNNWGTSNKVVKTISLAEEFRNVGFDYNSVTGVDGDPISAAVEFGSTASPVRATFLPNGLLADPGRFYLLPSPDKGSRSDRMHAVDVGRAGQVALYRYDSKAGAWKEL